MNNQIRILNIKTNEIKTIALQGDGNLERNLLANYLEPDDYVEIPNDSKEYIYDQENLQVIEKPLDLSKLKTESHEINKKKHEEFQAKPFILHVTRDNATTVDLILDCTDNTSDNVLRAYLIAEKTGDAPFYGAKGEGSDIRFSYLEMEQVYQQFQARLKPSFDTKGQTKFLIDQAQTVEELQEIMANLDYN